MSKVVREWVNALPGSERITIVRAAYECIEAFGANSPMGRAVRQAVLADDVVFGPDDTPLGAGELLVYFDTFIGAMSVIPAAAVTLVHRVATTLEVHAPGIGPGYIPDGWQAGDMRECWGALRRAIDERRAAGDPDAGAGVARVKADARAAVDFITGPMPADEADPTGGAVADAI